MVSQPQTAIYEIELPEGEYSVVGTYQGFEACETGAPVCGAPSAPAIEPFVRSGFSAVEWGVVLDAGTF